ncbi:MAG: hypothetical protein M1816_000449 [Peltula sp. TS41687]|nr:MAG: hypothetical protein M1816_000449 [Peltula sp. TS41687]
MSRPSIPSRAAVKEASARSGPLANGTTYVYDYFTEQRSSNAPPITYIVMEKVHGQSPVEYSKQHPDETEVVDDQIAAAVRHIWQLPLPPGPFIGHLAGEKANDWFFSGDGADRTFQSVQDLEGWINDKLEDVGRPERVNSKGIECRICHGDLSQHNILYGASRVIILDWGMSGIYPGVVDEFALIRQFSNRGGKYASRLHKKLFGDKFSVLIGPLMRVANINAFGY